MRTSHPDGILQFLRYTHLPRAHWAHEDALSLVCILATARLKSNMVSVVRISAAVAGDDRLGFRYGDNRQEKYRGKALLAPLAKIRDESASGAMPALRDAVLHGPLDRFDTENNEHADPIIAGCSRLQSRDRRKRL